MASMVIGSPALEKETEATFSGKRDGGRRRRTDVEAGNSPVANMLYHPRSSRKSMSAETELLLGLSIAGVGLTLLTTTYSLFHVDIFLRAYQLPLSTYSFQSFVFGIINTVNDVVGAWVVDHYAMSQSRSDLVGLSTCAFGLCFLSPFFRWKQPTGWDGIHFVVSTSLYDTMLSFTSILIGSVVSDNHLMSDTARVQFMASGKIANLVASFVVARLGLAVFAINDLRPFRIFVVVLACLVILLAIMAQYFVTGSSKKRGKCFNLFPTRMHYHGDTCEAFVLNSSTTKLHLRRVAHDFWTHSNFLAWVGMEMLLEAQITFVLNFSKTFVDNLATDFSQTTCDWILSSIRPMTQVASILAYWPIRRMGYPRVYALLFRFNLALSLLLLLFVNISDHKTSSSFWITTFLSIYSVGTGAVQSAGFALAQADMVLEMKQKHINEGRHDEPSLAGLFMGANALFCKPVESFLPTVAASVLDRYDTSKESLFHLLVIPPLVFSCLQIVAWSRFDLTPARTAKMRDELRALRKFESP